jgi:hypothetical protein
VNAQRAQQMSSATSAEKTMRIFRGRLLSQANDVRAAHQFSAVPSAKADIKFIFEAESPQPLPTRAGCGLSVNHVG